MLLVYEPAPAVEEESSSIPRSATTEAYQNTVVDVQAQLVKDDDLLFDSGTVIIKPSVELPTDILTSA